MNKTLITQILATSEKMINRRDPRDVLMTLMEEVGELATEIAIVSGHKNRDPSPDGIIGETLDVIIAATDILHLMYKDGWTAEHIEMLMMQRAEAKLMKWENNVSEIRSIKRSHIEQAIKEAEQDNMYEVSEHLSGSQC